MEFEVQTGNLRKLVGNLDLIKDKISRISTNVGRVGNALAIDDSAAASVKKTINRLSAEIEGSADKAGKLSSGLNQTAVWYEQCECNICGLKIDINQTDTETDAVTETDGEYSWTDFWTDFWKKDIWKFAAEGGIFGSGTAVILNLLTGGDSAKSWMTSGKYLAKLIGNAASAAGKANWKDYLLGFNNGLTGLDMSGAGSAWSSYLNKTLDDISFDTGGTIAKNTKVAAKWTGYVFTVLGNAVENYDEYKTSNGAMSEERAVAETVIESGVDIGLGVVSGAAVAAGCAALGIVSAPAVVTGAAAVGIAWAANSVCKWATGGKDIGEVVADAVCDGFSAAKNRVSNIVSGISAKWSKGILAFG